MSVGGSGSVRIREARPQTEELQKPKESTPPPPQTDKKGEEAKKTEEPKKREVPPRKDNLESLLKKAIFSSLEKILQKYGIQKSKAHTVEPEKAEFKKIDKIDNKELKKLGEELKKIHKFEFDLKKLLKGAEEKLPKRQFYIDIRKTG